MSAKPITTVNYVDLKHFMGDWYGIANIPTFIELDTEGYDISQVQKVPQQWQRRFNLSPAAIWC